MSDDLDRLPREAIIAHFVLQGWVPMSSAPEFPDDRDCLRLVNPTKRRNYSCTRPAGIRFNCGWSPAATPWWPAPWAIVPMKFLRAAARAEIARQLLDRDTEFTVDYRPEDHDEY